MVAGTQRSAYSSYCLLLQTPQKVSAGLRLHLVCLEGTAAYVVVCMGGSRSLCASIPAMPQILQKSLT